MQATASAVALVATDAVADLGVNGGGVRLVRVRIVDRMDVALMVTTDREIVLSEEPKLCLIGPYSAPDDAGLSDPCWGEPDLTTLVLAMLDRTGQGHYVLRTGAPNVINAAIGRGAERCDYPPGTWEVEFKLNALLDGAALGARYVPDTPFDVPVSQPGPLPWLAPTETRYCGLATAVYQQQGEPEVIEP